MMTAIVTDPALLFCALAAVVLLAVWLADTVHALRKIGSAATAILIALLLSNTGIFPGTSPVYDFLLGRGVIAGIVLILLSVDIRSIRSAGAPMLAAFGLGAVGSVVGAMVMAALVGGALGDETWRLAGQFSATYIGGGMNFAAVGQELGTRSDLFSAGIAADVIVTAIWLVACLTIPEFMPKRRGATAVSEYASRAEASRVDTVAASDDQEASDDAGSTQPMGLDRLLGSSGTPMTLTDFAGLTTITFGTIAASEYLAAWWPAMPKVLWLTTLTLLLAQLPVIRKLSGGVVLGNFLLLLFLASNGAKSVIARIVEVGPAIFYFAAGTVLIHGLIIFGLGFAFRMNGDLIAVASQASVGGSTTAMALAGARRRTDLILPGVVAGMLGNALGNYVGVAVAWIVRGYA
ncbi:MAG: DUF819 family protein [Gemmatimonadota bacterium]